MFASSSTSSVVTFSFFLFFVFVWAASYLSLQIRQIIAKDYNISKIVLLFRVSYIKLPKLLPIFQVYILLCVSNINFVFQFNLILQQFCFS